MTNQWHAVVRATELSERQRWPEAVACWREVVRDNPVNGAYWDWWGEAQFATEDYAGALASYRQALRLGVWDRRKPWDSVFPGEIAYRIARCHARLGDREAALAALAEAVALGLRNPDRAASDEHLACLRGHSRFGELAGPVVTPDMSRVEGWRADLAVLAQEVRRRSPARHEVSTEFAAAVAALHQAIPGLTDAGVVVEMWRLLRMLGDGHAKLNFGSAHPHWLRSLPVCGYLFAEGLFVTEAHPDYADLLGAEVLAYDGRPVPEVLAALDPVLTRDNEYGPMAAAPRWLRRSVFLHELGVADDPDKVTVTVRLAGGTVTDVTLRAREETPRWLNVRKAPADWPWLPETLPEPLPAYLRAAETPYWFADYPEAALLYCQFNGVSDRPDEPLSDFYPRLFRHLEERDLRRLVIDLRWNPGGNTFKALPLVHHVIRNDRINQAGNLFVIIGRGTFSAAQNTATLLNRHTHAIFVGEPTGSSPNFVGETAPFRLPYSGLEANVSDLYWQTSWPLDYRTAIAPDVYAPPTFEAFRVNQDPAMAAILAVIDD